MTDNQTLKICDANNYLNKQIIYLKNTNITEYDINSAGFSVIKFKKLLPEDEISYLDKLEKYPRNVRIGNRMKEYPKIAEEIILTLEKVRKAFAILNNIQAEDILSIKKDAMFIIKKKAIKMNVQNFFQFREENVYTSYVYLNKKEFYYSARTNILHVKGISDENLEKHHEYLLKNISDILEKAERFSSEQLLTYLKIYRGKYLNKTLPIETYRELDSGLFRLKTKNGSKVYFLQNISSDMLDELDISQNYISYILPLINAIL